MALNIIFMGSPDFAVPALRALHASEHEVVAAYCQPPRPAGRGHKERLTAVHAEANKLAIPVHCPTSLKSETIQAQMRCHGADVAVVAAYGLLLPKAVLEIPRLGCINIHPSKLPRWRGAAPLQRTLMAGDTETEMCIMQMDEGLDTGDVLLREPVEIPDTWNAGDLHDHMASLGAECTLKVLDQLEQGTAIATPQPEVGITYAAKITKEEAKIDWGRSADELIHHIRGLNPFPAAWTELAGERIKVFKAERVPYSGAAIAGTLIDDALTIACGSDALRITELQRTGKKRMSADEALRGWDIKASS